MVGEDAIDAHGEYGVELAVELGVPGERPTAEAVEQRRVAAVPVVDMHVDDIDAGITQQRGSPFRAFLDATEARRVDELDVVREHAPRRGLLPRRRAEEEVRQ